MRGNRDLSLLAAGAAVSEFGNSLSLLVLLFRATPISPLLVAAILVAELLPLVLGAPLAGALVDRLRNRRLLIIALLGQGVAIAAIAPLMGTPALVVALVFLSGCGRAVAIPATSALVPHIAGEEEATRGYAMVGTAQHRQHRGRHGWCAVGGRLRPPRRVADRRRHVPRLRVVAGVRAGRTQAERRAQGTSECAGGIRHVRHDPVLLVAITGLAFFVGAVVVINVADPAFVRFVLHGDEFCWARCRRAGWSASCSATGWRRG